MSIDPAALNALADAVKNGLLALTIVILVVGGQRRWYVFGWLYSDLVKDRDEWKAMALHGAHVAERATTVAESIASPTR